jgi:hypothetical protein
LRLNLSQLRKAVQIQYILRLKEFLPHRRDQISAASQHTDIARMLRKVRHSLVNRAWAK